jgi:predicted RNA methylase
MSMQALTPAERALSQFQTPMWLARKMAAWVWRGARVLEPCAGRGNLVAALLEIGHAPGNIVAIEKDAGCALELTARCPGVSVSCADFLAIPAAPRIDCVLMNSPFEGDSMLRFTLKALETARECVLLAPVAIEYSLSRDEGLWRDKAVVTRRARLPRRPRFGGDQGGKFDCVVLKLKRRDEPRRDDEIAQVSEEVWREQ